MIVRTKRHRRAGRLPRSIYPISAFRHCFLLRTYCPSRLIVIFVPVGGLTREISQNRFPYLSSSRVPSRREWYTVAILPESRRSYRNIAPNLETEGNTIGYTCADLRDTHSAEGHCCPATIYCLLCGIVDRRRIQYTVGLTLNGLFYDGTPSFSAADVVGSIYLEIT